MSSLGIEKLHIIFFVSGVCVDSFQFLSCAVNYQKETSADWTELVWKNGQLGNNVFFLGYYIIVFVFRFGSDGTVVVLQFF